MKIVLATETFYPAVDSTTTTLKATADRLIDRGHTVRIIAPGPGLASYRGCDVVRVRPLEPTGAQIRDTIEAFAPDLVQVHSPRAIGRKALKHAARAGVPTIAVEQSPVLDLAADYWRTKVAERADRVLVTSPWMVERAAELGINAHLWLPGVDPAAFSPALRDQWLHGSWSKAKSKEGRRVVVGYVGGLHKAAGVRRLADLASVPGIRLVVVGGGPEREWLARRLPDARFTGPLGVGDLTVAVPTLDLLVHPGEHETDCHALREAASAGVPVVAPRAGGARHVVSHLETGVLYDNADPRDFSRAVAAVAFDPHRGLLGAAGREVAGRRTWTDAVDDLILSHHPANVPVSA
ncbi:MULTISPECIES: glycosyltransferase [unclassified Nocardioides]|uniref:glycosyltransferase n=1 Tax=unclassified Nocardioides TaxID=2615069 RepID=UPI0007011F2D|nr:MULTISPECIES: glycosyltransferase [unclassified Nocardioides]KRA38288.1 glycosyl transferase family 1 [Nocardioides sp. Root614]KRA92247.1 glycosyl transferase family 1 [Nocardioides sp. Root682]